MGTWNPQYCIFLEVLEWLKLVHIQLSYYHNLTNNIFLEIGGEESVPQLDLPQDHHEGRPSECLKSLFCEFLDLLLNVQMYSKKEV